MNQELKMNIKRLAFGVLEDQRILLEDDFDFNCSDKMDSVNRVAILVAIENEYEFIFKLKEISSWNTIGQLTEIVANKL